MIYGRDPFSDVIWSGLADLFLSRRVPSVRAIIYEYIVYLNFMISVDEWLVLWALDMITGSIPGETFYIGSWVDVLGSALELIPDTYNRGNAR